MMVGVDIRREVTEFMFNLPMNSQETDSSILIITIDCNHKSKGGVPSYQSHNSIFASNIDNVNKAKIGEKRQEIFELLKKGLC
jgi:hypothetical protein